MKRNEIQQDQFDSEIKKVNKKSSSKSTAKTKNSSKSKKETTTTLKKKNTTKPKKTDKSTSLKIKKHRQHEEDYDDKYEDEENQQQNNDENNDEDDIVMTRSSYQEEDDEMYDDIFDDDPLAYDENKESKPKRRGRKSKTDTRYYVNNADLATEIRKYQTTGVISEELGVMLMNIANRFATHPRFFNYTYREDFVSDAICRMITTGINKINLDLPNCNIFAYMTQLCFNSFRQKIKSEKKFSNLKTKLSNEIYDEFERVESLQGSVGNNEDD